MGFRALLDVTLPRSFGDGLSGIRWWLILFDWIGNSASFRLGHGITLDMAFPCFMTHGLSSVGRSGRGRVLVFVVIGQWAWRRDGEGGAQGEQKEGGGLHVKDRFGGFPTLSGTGL